MWLRGFDQWIMDIATQPEITVAILKKIWDYQIPIYEKYLKVNGKYLDVAMIGDDLGMQTGLFISPDLYRQFLKPWHKKRIEFIKERAQNVPIILHSCGSIYEIIKDLIEIGLDGLHPIQPFARDMEPEKLKKEFGDKLLFVGGLDHQRILGKSKEEIEDFIDRLMKAYAPGGGFFLAATHDIPPDIKPENIIEAYDYVVKTGKYPININT